MPRKISWQPQLQILHRRVSESAQTMYTRAGLETLFDLGERAAQMLLELMPRHMVGTGVVVDRQDLIDWLNRCTDAEDLSAHLAALRKDPPKPQRRRLRIERPRVMDSVPLDVLRSRGIWFEKGGLTVDFTTLADFIGKMMQVAEACQQPEFERRFCDPAPLAVPATTRSAAIAHDTAAMKLASEFMRCVLAAEKYSNSGRRERAAALGRRACTAFEQLRDLWLDNGNEPDDTLALAYRELISPW